MITHSIFWENSLNFLYVNIYFILIEIPEIIKFNQKYFVIFDEIFLFKVLYFSDFVNFFNKEEEVILIIWHINTINVFLTILLSFLNDVSIIIIDVVIIIIKEEINKDLNLSFFLVTVEV